MTRDRLMRLVRQGLVRRVVKGVYVDAVCPDTLELRAAALALVTPESAVVTDRTAAWLHGVSVLAKNDHLAVPPVTVFRLAGYTRIRTRSNIGGERSLLVRDIEVVHGVRVTTPLRTALDLGRLTRRDDAIGCLDALLATGRFSRAELLAEIPRFRGFRGVVQLRELAPLADERAESMPESVLRLRWIDAGLPAPETQQWICDRFGEPIYRVDLGSNTVPYAAEYDGEEFHTEPAQRAHDERRRRWIHSRGQLLDVFTKGDLYGSPVAVMARLQRGHRLAAAQQHRVAAPSAS